MIPVRERAHENEHRGLARAKDAPPCTVGITTTARLRTKRNEREEQEEQPELEASACASHRFPADVGSIGAGREEGAVEHAALQIAQAGA
eukprot:15457848-Alexandrium_andersonii.AAC.1